MLVTLYFADMGSESALHPSTAPWLLDVSKTKRDGLRFEDVRQMKIHVTSDVDTFIKENYKMSCKKWLERCNKCLEAGGTYLE